MDIWCEEWIGRWGFEGRIGAMLSEQVDGDGGIGSRDGDGGGWDFGAAVGVGRESFGGMAKGVKEGRGRGRGRGTSGWGFGWGMGDVRAWWAGRRGSVEVGGVGEVGDEDVLPVYTEGEHPPAYRR